MSSNPFAAPRASDLQQHDVNTEDERIRREHLGRETSIRTFGSLSIIGAVVAAPAAVFLLFSMPREGIMTIATYLSSAFAVAFCAYSAWNGARLYALHPRARVPAIVLAVVGLLFFPLGTIVNGLGLYLLFSKKGARIFAEDYRGIVERTPHLRYRSSALVWAAAITLLLAVGIGLAASITR